ncbi:hypothetical protein ABZT03_08950 [Streptomyces sp. NPDC005574]|uniref:hypothetical protein n=1 Tax=Streptomyces sp. NPDC005574 TaxID=3156891 RepID=UPI0033A98C58
MRLRAVSALASGAAVLAALALPTAAQAQPQPGAVAGLRALAVQPGTVIGNAKFSNAVVNGGKSVVIGATAKKSFKVTYDVYDENGVVLSQVFLWQGTDSSDVNGITGGLEADDAADCTESTTRTGFYSCEATFTVDPRRDLAGNGVAGTWKLLLGVYDLYANVSTDDDVTRTLIKRASKLTADASPEPVKKGKTITVKGKLTRANWDTGTYQGYRGQTAHLQFRKKGSSVYGTLKSVTSGTGGVLTATTVAKEDGYYRFVYAGTKATDAAKATGDFVDVR